MRNTTKLKNILILYTVSIDMDENMNLHFTLIDKRNQRKTTIVAKSYTVAVAKAYSHMLKETRLKNY